ncbi:MULTISPECIES: enoyl-ACP reductase [Halobacteriovorax]|uniref:Enoyl-[acyl-carrier-protein] reductase [NADH] n=1 Tax=Halobacteriovorax vibrionivorans TaxID=2152716 RepID=A0ABY0IDP3_9BACT|nr:MULTISPECIES: enoyl-ACP reductase [Halobacteriovorax]RZF21081.1 enoyl-ACP reductase [Halobacteriovorax vibrionivorans]TGD47033.1 enoyl-ACP reductase [Halobacteriovorax sp. Y22]
MGILEGKKVLVLGLANDKSIAWGISKQMKEQGARLAFSYLNEALQKRVEPLSEEIGGEFTFELDVQNEEHMTKMAEIVKEKWGDVDVIVHSLAFADKTDLKDRFHKTSREGFKMAQDISAYSLLGVCNVLKPLMAKDCSVIALTYHGSVKVLNGYNVMGVAKASLESTMRYLADDLGPEGIRVNCISAGPIRTLAASGVPGLKGFLNDVEEKSPLRRNVTQEDVGGAAVFLGSRLANGVTGQVLYVDSGISILGA